jgi:C2H2-type zinc finger/Zinc finger, C2H2 type
VFKKTTEGFSFKEDDPLKKTTNFKCPNCPSTFLKKKLFQNHMARHREQNYIICPIEGCSLRLFRGDRFGHIKRCHAPKVDEKGEPIRPEAICELCGKTGFKSMETYRKHKYKVHCPRCEVCNKKLKKKVPHICEVKREKGRIFKCSDCSKSFTTGKILKRHMKEQHNFSGINELTCVDCNRIFPTIHKLQSHKKICNCLQCHICGVGFRTEEKLNDHVAKHGNEVEERNFECEYCKCRFSKEIILKRHIAKRHDEGPEEIKMNYECSKCDVMYRKSDLLRLHLESKHNVFVENIDITCVFCFELFEENEVALHVSSHKRIYACQYEGCKKKFRSDESLADHELKHDPNYKVDLCCTV